MLFASAFFGVVGWNLIETYKLRVLLAELVVQIKNLNEHKDHQEREIERLKADRILNGHNHKARN